MRYSTLERNMKHMDKLILPMQSKVIMILARLDDQGWQPVIASSLRSMKQQREKVRLGYSKTYNSRHLYGRAVDIIDRRWGWRGPTANKNHAFWAALEEAGEAQGLFSGNRWRMRDVAHLELKWASRKEKRYDMRRMGLL